MKLRGSEVCVKQDHFTHGSCSTPGSTSPASGSRNFWRPIRATKLQISGKFSARRAQKKCVNSASVVAQTEEFRCTSFSNRCAVYCKVKRESSAEITQNLRKNLAKILQKFRKFGTPRVQKLRGLGHRALRTLHNVSES